MSTKPYCPYPEASHGMGLRSKTRYFSPFNITRLSLTFLSHFHSLSLNLTFSLTLPRVWPQNLCLSHSLSPYLSLSRCHSHAYTQFCLLFRSVGIDCQYFDSKFSKFRSIKANREADPSKEIVVVLANLAGTYALRCLYYVYLISLCLFISLSLSLSLYLASSLCLSLSLSLFRCLSLYPSFSLPIHLFIFLSLFSKNTVSPSFLYLFIYLSTQPILTVMHSIFSLLF